MPAIRVLPVTCARRAHTSTSGQVMSTSTSALLVTTAQRVRRPRRPCRAALERTFHCPWTPLTAVTVCTSTTTKVTAHHAQQRFTARKQSMALAAEPTRAWWQCICFVGILLVGCWLACMAGIQGPNSYITYLLPFLPMVCVRARQVLHVPDRVLLPHWLTIRVPVPVPGWQVQRPDWPR